MFAQSSPDQANSVTPPALSELQTELAALAGQVAAITAERARRAGVMARAGAETARETVSDYPLASLAVAFAAGALIGLAVTTPARPSRAWSGHDMKRDLAGYADDLRRSIRSSATGASMADNLERLSSALSAVDAKATVGPAVDRLLGWFNQARTAASAAMNKAAN